MKNKDLFMRKRTPKEIAKNKLELEYQIYSTEMWIKQHEQLPMEWNQDQIKMLNKHLETLENELKTYEQETK